MPPQFSQTPSGPAPIIPPKSKEYKTWFLISAGFFLIALNLWMMQDMYSPKPDSIIQPLAQTETTDQFADWQTYRNEEYGFEFKYQYDLEVIHLTGAWGGSQFYLRRPGFKEVRITTSRSSNKDPRFLEEYGSIKSTKTVRIGDRDWFEFMVSESGKEPYVPYYQRAENYIFYQLGGDIQDFKDILSTFKFTK